MKKVIGIVTLCIMMICTMSFATTEDILPVNDVANYDIMPISEVSTNIEEDDYKIIYDDVYKMEKQVTIDEAIDGNVYIMAQDLKIENAIIDGNLYVMAENIEIINSEIQGSIYAGGEKISFSGMTNDVYAFGSDIDFDVNSCIWRNVKVVGENVNMYGSVGRNFYAGVNNLTIGDNAIIDGILKYTSENEGNISEEARIAEVQFEQEENMKAETQNVSVGDYIYKVLKVAFKTLIVVLIIVFSINKFKSIKRTNNTAIDLLQYVAKGSLLLVLTPIIVILLMCTVIGIGLGFVILALYIIMLYISISLVSAEIAYRILNKENDEIVKGKMIGLSILVSFIICAVGFIPILGGIVKIIVVLIGLGIMFDILFQKVKKEEINEN